MNRADRRAWRSARTLEDLGELTARWIEGAIGEQPAYYGPSDLDDPGVLVPVCAALCRAGFVTAQSQQACDGPGRDGLHWRQRAAVEGFASASAAAAVCGAWQVTVIDPEWGRADLLWRVLADAVAGGAR